MTEPVSRTRLQQIALRRLSALGLAVRHEGESIAGELGTGAYGLKNPASGERIDQVNFVVEGHDRMRLTSPPLLALLPPLPLFEHEALGSLVNQIASLLERRLSAAQQQASRLRAAGLPAEIDGARLVAVSRMELTPQGVAVLEGTEEGIRAMELLPPSRSKRAPRSLGGVAIDLREFTDRVDLEIYMSGLADRAAPPPEEAPAASPRDSDIFAPLGQVGSGGGPFASSFEMPGGGWSGAAGWNEAADPAPPANTAANWADDDAPAWAEPARPPAPAPAREPSPGPVFTVTAAGSRPQAPPQVTVQLPTSGPMTLEILGRLFGAEATLAQGFTVVRDVEAAGQRVRFTARHEAGRTFQGRISGPAGTLWEDRFQLDAFPGAPAFVAQRLAAPRQGPRPESPAVGQVWWMAVKVEGEDASGVRYLMVTADGKPTAAARVLRREEFEATFAPGPAGPRLLARVVEVAGDQVAYEQLDPRGQTVGTPRRSPQRTFVASFRPDARP